MSGQYIAQMQASFQTMPYSAVIMSAAAKGTSRLRQLREAAGLSVRELARQIDEQHTNVSYWERSGNLPRADLLRPIAEALSVTVEQLLGDVPQRAMPAGGRLRQLFERASKLPRRQQEKLISVIEPFVASQKPEPAEKAS
jgi:transcriptional regulator with XRE-family HTH domain